MGKAAYRAASALVALVLAPLPTSPLRAASTIATSEQLRLLAATDPFSAVPAELRVELVFSTGATGARVPLELWRKGNALALVRFLLPKDRGKYIIRRDNSFWFLSPNAKKPVKLAPALAPSGAAALDELLAVRPSLDYLVAAVTEERGQVTFDLEAKPGNTGSPKVRWVVDGARRLPLRAEFRGADNRLTRMIEFKRWRDPAKLVPAAIVAKEIARGGLPLEVEFVAIEGRAVSAALFDLADGTARAALPLPASPVTDAAAPRAKP